MSTIRNNEHKGLNVLNLLLASSSPSRKETLERLGLSFECFSPDIDETQKDHESPLDLVRRLSYEKAKRAQAMYPNHLILAGDQILNLNGKVLGKPHHLAGGRDQLLELSGQDAVFHTGICLLNAASDSIHIDVIDTKVVFKTLTIEQIDRYLHQDKPFNCAGSIRFEGSALLLLDQVYSPDPSAITGLPVMALHHMLVQEGIHPLNLIGNEG